MAEDKLTEKPGYYAIIPANIRYDKNLSPQAKLIYGEITCLLNFKNKCFATNAYFARLYEISDIQISRLIKQLVDAGYIVTEMETTAKGNSRLIKLALNINDYTPINKNVKGGINKNDKDNIQHTNNNSLFNNKEGDAYEKFINDFNIIRKSKFQPIQKVRTAFRNCLKTHTSSEILQALKNAMKDEHHIDREFNDLTPEFITRLDKLEKYINYKPNKTARTSGASLTL